MSERKFERRPFVLEFKSVDKPWQHEVVISCYGDDSQYTWELTPSEALEVWALLDAYRLDIIQLSG
jgi:hypothetical protein